MAPDIWTSYELLKDAGACAEELRAGARKFGGIKKHGRKTKTPLVKVLDKVGLNNALWTLDHAVEGEDAHRILHQFRADCAIRVLKYFERDRPDDTRPRDAISSTRRYAVGQETDAAWAAAGGAAWGAAGGAAGDAERDWQETRLRDYLIGKAKPMRMPPRLRKTKKAA